MTASLGTKSIVFPKSAALPGAFRTVLARGRCPELVAVVTVMCAVHQDGGWPSSGLVSGPPSGRVDPTMLSLLGQRFTRPLSSCCSTPGWGGVGGKGCRAPGLARGPRRVRMEASWLTAQRRAPRVPWLLPFLPAVQEHRRDAFHQVGGDTDGSPSRFSEVDPYLCCQSAWWAEGPPERPPPGPWDTWTPSATGDAHEGPPRPLDELSSQHMLRVSPWFDLFTYVCWGACAFLRFCLVVAVLV